MLVAISHQLNWIAIDRLSTMWKSYLSDKIKRELFLAVAVAVLLYEWTTWMLTKWMVKNKMGTTQNVMRCFEQILEATSHKK